MKTKTQIRMKTKTKNKNKNKILVDNIWVLIYRLL